MIKIVNPEISDIKSIQVVFYETWLATYPNENLGITREDIDKRFENRFSKERMAKRVKEIQDTSGKQLFLAAKDGDNLVGVCILSKDESLNRLNAIYILPEYQKRGIGKMFWEKAGDFFDKDKDIVVEVADYNENAISFYRKLGFIETGRRFECEKFRMPVSGVIIPDLEMIIKVKN